MVRTFTLLKLLRLQHTTKRTKTKALTISSFQKTTSGDFVYLKNANMLRPTQNRSFFAYFRWNLDCSCHFINNRKNSFASTTIFIQTAIAAQKYLANYKITQQSSKFINLTSVKIRKRGYQQQNLRIFLLADITTQFWRELIKYGEEVKVCLVLKLISTLNNSSLQTQMTNPQLPHCNEGVKIDL